MVEAFSNEVFVGIKKIEGGYVVSDAWGERVFVDLVNVLEFVEKGLNIPLLSERPM